MADVCGYKFLVIDNQDLLEISHLKRKTNQAVKHPEPVLKLDAPWDIRKSDELNSINVIYDEQDELFKMWYTVIGRILGQYWGSGLKSAYATSKDGIHWEKPIMNMVEINGSKENNYIIEEMKSLYHTIIIDPSDIPARRYKMILAVDSKETSWAKFHIPLNLAYSSDGIIWNRPEHVNPVMRGISDGVWSLLYDRDRRKYQIYSRRVPNLPRDISLYESHDLVNWEDKGRVLVGGDELDPPEMYNLHGMIPFFYEDFCLAVLETIYFLPEMENACVHQAPSEDWPFKNLGILDIQFSYSRDGQTWSRPQDRSPIIPTGSSDSPDEGVTFSARSAPLVIDGDTWMYYTACRNRHTYWSQKEIMAKYGNDARQSHCAMLAIMPEDHWVSLDADNNEGHFVCKPWGPPHEIFVNTDAEGGSVEAELVTPYGKVVPEYSRGDCVAITANGKNQLLKWKHGKSPWETIAKDHLGGLLVKFYLKNAKLYSYTFTLPDPNGQLEQDRVNARWCESIKHRSNNWGRNSNEPAGGVPSYSEPGPKE